MTHHRQHSIWNWRFWLAQTGFWFLYWWVGIIQSLEDHLNNGSNWLAVDNLIYHSLPALPGFLITSVFHIIFVQIKNKQSQKFIFVVLICWFVGSLISSISHLESKYFLGISDHSYLNNWLLWSTFALSKLIILGAWIGVYVSIVSAGEIGRQKARRKELETAANNARSAMLRYQVNPHLLFNALNTVSGHVLNKDHDAADRSIQSLSSLLRFSLTDGESTSISLEQEVHRLKLYLDVERTRFGDKLKTHFDIPDEMRQTKLPPLLLQPLVENAMKHGISRSTKGGVVIISARQQGAQNTIRVRNEIPVEGIVEELPEKKICFGLGLRNVSERLEMFFEGQADMTITERTPTSFAIDINFPRTDEPEVDDED